ncbi:hypothetical protein OS493_040594, partial [Desmophyllum pertusum]
MEQENSHAERVPREFWCSTSNPSRVEYFFTNCCGNKFLYEVWNDTYSANMWKSSDALQQEKDENIRLKQYLDQILKEIEEKAPVLQQQRKDFEQALHSVDQLSRRLDSALVENEESKVFAEEAAKKSEHLKRENDRLRNLSADLSQQVQVLLKECEEARGGVVSSEPRLHPMSSTEVTSSSQVISEHLVTFRSIEELQQQNQKLLGVIRELSEEKEKREGDN